MPVDPSSLRIELFPAPILREKAKPVEATDEVLAVVDRMVELMRGAEGIGLAATQVGLPWRLFVCDVPPDDEAAHDPVEHTDGPVAFLNPVIESSEGVPDAYEEGCLSLPGIRGDVIRPPIVTVSAIGRDGQPFEVRAGGLLSRCLQHEIDHLDGVLIFDKMTDRARARVKNSIRALERTAR